MKVLAGTVTMRDAGVRASTLGMRAPPLVLSPAGSCAASSSPSQ